MYYKHIVIHTSFFLVLGMHCFGPFRMVASAGVASVPGTISLSKKNCGHGCKFDAAPSPVSMSGGCNDCDRFYLRPTPASAAYEDEDWMQRDLTKARQLTCLVKVSHSGKV
ncbi:hypothetical protein F5888DRAFT_1150164 [Russula emetica]|nr:hypothetical protein F5888DRAFT_1150164 [Russula emetica]